MSRNALREICIFAHILLVYHMTNRKKTTLFLLLLGIIVATGLIIYSFFYARFSTSNDHAYIYIDRDDNIDSVYVKLEATASPSRIMMFKLLAKATEYDQNVKTGKYETGNGLTPAILINNLRNKIQVPVRLMVPSARTFERFVSQIAKAIEPDSAELLRCIQDSSQWTKYGHNQATISCIFIPNTYEVYWDITPEQFMNRMKKECDRFWNEDRLLKAQQQGLSVIEVMTLASIVDRETANDGEKPSIAGLYLNRLRKGMLLQADPTVIYALQQMGIRRVLKKHLKVDSPYNTYLYKGLPPGPICIPEVSSIEAVLNAEKNNYIYMCAKEDFSGTHNFASSYSQHLRNARKYTRALNQRGIK